MQATIRTVRPISLSLYFFNLWHDCHVSNNSEFWSHNNSGLITWSYQEMGSKCGNCVFWHAWHTVSDVIPRLCRHSTYLFSFHLCVYLDCDHSIICYVELYVICSVIQFGFGLLSTYTLCMLSTIMSWNWALTDCKSLYGLMHIYWLFFFYPGITYIYSPHNCKSVLFHMIFYCLRWGKIIRPFQCCSSMEPVQFQRDVEDHRPWILLTYTAWLDQAEQTGTEQISSGSLLWDTRWSLQFGL